MYDPNYTTPYMVNCGYRWARLGDLNVGAEFLLPDGVAVHKKTSTGGMVKNTSDGGYPERYLHSDTWVWIQENSVGARLQRIDRLE